MFKITSKFEIAWLLLNKIKPFKKDFIDNKLTYFFPATAEVTKAVHNFSKQNLKIDLFMFCQLVRDLEREQVQ